MDKIFAGVIEREEDMGQRSGKDDKKKPKRIKEIKCDNCADSPFKNKFRKLKHMLTTCLHNTTESEELIKDVWQLKSKIEEIEKIFKKLDIPYYLAIGNLKRMYGNKEVITYRRQVYES